MPERDWEASYKNGDIPWDTDEPDGHLVQTISELGLGGGRALDIGCGTGTHALWLAGRGFEVVGLDISPRAVRAAEARAEGARGCVFRTHNFLEDELPRGPFSLVFDRGCFHVFNEATERSRFAQRVAELLAPDGLWLSIVGSTEGPSRDHGPPRRSLRDLTEAIEPWLAIERVEEVEFLANLPSKALAWRCASRPRAVAAQPSSTA